MDRARGWRKRIWEDWEIGLLRKLYPRGGYRAVREALPHRARYAIQQQAYRAGVHAPAARRGHPEAEWVAWGLIRRWRGPVCPGIGLLALGLRALGNPMNRNAPCTASEALCGPSATLSAGVIALETGAA